MTQAAVAVERLEKTLGKNQVLRGISFAALRLFPREALLTRS